MSLSSRASLRARAAGAMDAVQSLGLVVLLVGLGASEAAKSIGIGLAVLGFVGKSVLAGPPRPGATAPLVALGVFFLAGVLSVAAAAPGFGLPGELWTLAITDSNRGGSHVLNSWQLVVTPDTAGAPAPQAAAVDEAFATESDHLTPTDRNPALLSWVESTRPDYEDRELLRERAIDELAIILYE